MPGNHPHWEHPTDPFRHNRPPDDTKNALDLFHTRLLKPEATMHTAAAKQIAKRPTHFSRTFLGELEAELRSN